jgi:ketosteroid isomerase-like protein
MSRENVEIVRQHLRRMTDPSRLNFDFLDEEIELDIRPITPGYQEIIHGKDAVIDFWRDYLDTWEEFVLEPIEILEAAEDQVVVVLDVRGRGKGSGASFERRSGNIFTLRAGSVVKLKFFPDREAALQAAGLRE